MSVWHTLVHACLLIAAVQEEPGSAPRRLEGRVRDAFTGKPVAGAQVELLTENMYGEAERIAEARTGEHGAYRLEDHARRGEKLRVRHPAYRSTLDSSSSDEFVLFPRDEPCELLILDLEGNPIEGAEALLRQTCRHAPPTTEAKSDAAGRMTWPDLPPLRDNGEISVFADGYGALGNLEPSELAPRSTIYLPRRRPVRVRLVDEHGLPLAPGCCWYEGSDGGYPVMPDANGSVTLMRLFDEAGSVKRASSVACELPPAGDLYTLRYSNDEPAGDLSYLQILLDVPIKEERSVPLRGFHEQGYVRDGLYKGGEVVPGRWRVILGRAFSGYRETILALELAPGERRVLEPALEREPMLHVLLPEGGWTVHVQAGDDSISRFAKGDSFSTGVPPGGEVVVLAQGHGVRRARHAPWSGELTLDLRDPATLVEAAPPTEARFELAFHVRSAANEPIEVEASALTRYAALEDEDPSADGVRFRLPPGVRYEVRLGAENHVSIFRAGTAPADGARFEEIVLPRE